MNADVDTKRKYFCPLCGGKATVIGINDLTYYDEWQQRMHVMWRVLLECHNEPGCAILGCSVDVPYYT